MLLDLHWRPPERAAPHVRHSLPVAGENGSLVDSWEDGGYLPLEKKCCGWRRKKVVRTLARLFGLEHWVQRGEERIQGWLLQMEHNG